MHGACGATRCKIGGAQALIGGALEIIGGAWAPPKRYKVPPLVLTRSALGGGKYYPFPFAKNGKG